MATIARVHDYTADRDAGPPSSTISADKIDADFDNLITGVNGSLHKDGSQTATANIPFGGFKGTGHSVAAAAARSDTVSAANLQDNGVLFVAAGGTADVITATFSPNYTALVNGTELCIRASAANATTTPTFAAGSTAAKTIVKGANAALLVGDIAGQHHELRLRYNSTTDKWHLLNPVFGALSAIGGDQLNSLTTDATGGAVADFIPFVDASDSNASNKVTVQNFYDVSMAALTAKTLPVPADYFTIADSAASNVAKKATIQQLFDGMIGLTTEASPATGDFVPINDISASNVADKVTLGSIQTLFAASQAQQETGTSNAVNVTPGRQHNHPSACKAWVNFTTRGTNGACTVNASYNVDGVARTATGIYEVTFTTDFSTANYAVVAMSKAAIANNLLTTYDNPAVGTCEIVQQSASAGTATNSGDITATFFGDQ